MKYNDNVSRRQYFRVQVYESMNTIQILSNAIFLYKQDVC